MAASSTDKNRKYKSLFSTTLSTGIGTGTGDTITPASVSGLPTDTAITLTFDRVDSSGTATPTKLERIKGIISGGNLISYTRGVDGTTEQAHSAGAVIEMIWNAADWNDSIDAFLNEHTQSGAHTNLTASTINIGSSTQITGILDEDSMSSNSATKLATQQSTKAYVDTTVTGALTPSSVNINSTTLVDGVLDEDTMSSNSATKLATQQSIKAYADSLALNVKAGNTTRDISLASGTQAITGVGFTPKAVIFLAVINATQEWSVGVDDGTASTARGLGGIGSGTSTPITVQDNNGSDSIHIRVDASNHYAGYISAFGADGFTITWTKTGSPTGTVQIKYLALG